MSRSCEHCQKPIPADKRSDSRFCSETCRKYASRKRKTTKPKFRKAVKTPLAGLPVTAPRIEQETKAPVVIRQPELPPVPEVQQTEELTYAMMPPLRGYVEDTARVNLAKLPPPPDPPDVFDEPEPLPVEPMQEHYTVRVFNPKYAQIKKAIAAQQQKVQAQRDILARNKQVLKQITESQNLNALHYVAAGVGGGYLVGTLAPLKEKELGVVFGLLGGLAGAWVYDINTREAFEKKKAEAIKKQQQVIEQCQQYLRQFESELLPLNDALKRESELLSEPRVRLLNGATIDQREEEIEDYHQRREQAAQEWEEYRQRVANYEAKYGSINAIHDALSEEENAPTAEINDAGVVSSLNLNRVVGGALLFKGAWRNFFGAPSRDFKLIIHGPSFGGKSHLALQFAYYLAVHHGKVLYNTSEEGFSRTMDAKLEKLGARVQGLDIGRYTTIGELKEKIPRTTYNFIVLDSVSDMNMSAEDLQELRRYYCCSAIIGVCQNTKSGDIRGGYDLVHDADIKIRVENKTAYSDKNRFIDDRPELEIFNIAPVPATAKGVVRAGETEALPEHNTADDPQESFEPLISSESDEQQNGEAPDEYDPDDYDAIDHII